MKREEVDRACGQTPCLCGAIDTWHPECFAGKSKSSVAAGYDKAYQIARRKLRSRAQETTRLLVGLVSAHSCVYREDD